MDFYEICSTIMKFQNPSYPTSLVIILPRSIDKTSESCFIQSRVGRRLRGQTLCDCFIRIIGHMPFRRLLTSDFKYIQWWAVNFFENFVVPCFPDIPHYPWVCTDSLLWNSMMLWMREQMTHILPEILIREVCGDAWRFDKSQNCSAGGHVEITWFIVSSQCLYRGQQQSTRMCLWARRSLTAWAPERGCHKKCSILFVIKTFQACSFIELKEGNSRKNWVSSPSFLCATSYPDLTVYLP